MSNLSKNAMSASLKFLMTKSTLNNVTVSDITDNCGLSRQTFYYHFQDVFEVLELISIEEVINKMEPFIKKGNWQNGFLFFFNYMIDNKKFCLNVLNSLEREHTERYLYNLSYNMLYVYINNISENLPDSKKEFIANFLSFAFIGIVIKWSKGGMKENPEIIIEDIEKFMYGDIQKMYK